MVRILSIDEQISGVEVQHKLTKIDTFKELKTKLIKEVVKKSLIELAVALAFTAVACFFVATPMGMATLFICAVTAVAINILLRSASAYCVFRLSQLKYSNSPHAMDKRAKFEKVLGFLKYLVPMTFTGLVDANTREVLVHEAGHALAAKILVQNPQPRITINPLQGGQTSYRLGPLTKIGEFFGREKTKLLVTAAGPALAVITATTLLGTSLALRKSNPELSRYLKVMAVDSIAQHVFYALSALWTTATHTTHDFVKLMAGGIHPALAIVSMVALPIIVRIGFFIYDKVKAKMAAKAAEKEAIHRNKEYRIHLTPKNVPLKDLALGAVAA